MTRLGSKLPFEQAVEEVWLNQQTRVAERTLRETTYRYGRLAEGLERAEVERLERDAPPAKATPEQLLVSADGAYIHLTSGEWREVKTMMVGEFEPVWNKKAGEVEVKTRDISYFSRSYRIREFERYALAELQRRGLDNARLIVSVNDGSEWIQSFASYHFPQAIHVLDFGHALEHVAAAGKAVLGEGNEVFEPWLKGMAKQLKHKPPQHTIADICLLAAKATSEEQLAIIDDARRYLQKREELMDYPHFQAQGFPIGSGSVESSHKVVVHSRMKQAGMRWAEDHVDPMLALRNLVCNGRWSQGWSQIVAYHWQQQRQQQANKQPPASPPPTFASVKVAPVIPAEDGPSRPLTNNNDPYRPAADHLWRRGIWPTHEAWRWN